MSAPTSPTAHVCPLCEQTAPAPRALAGGPKDLALELLRRSIVVVKDLTEDQCETLRQTNILLLLHTAVAGLRAGQLASRGNLQESLMNLVAKVMHTVGDAMNAAPGAPSGGANGGSNGHGQPPSATR